MHDTRTISVMEDIHGANDRIADHINHELTHKRVFAVNVMGAPGIGKTTVVTQTLRRLTRLAPCVIEGDIESDIDTQTLRGLGVPAWQINTFGACHLDAPLVQNAVQNMDFEAIRGSGGDSRDGRDSGGGSRGSRDGGGDSRDSGGDSREGSGGGCLLFIENVGNLVCPAEFSIGEHAKLLVCSVTEGGDKPYKYPLAFERADFIVLNKIDLAPYVDFDEAFFMKGLRALNKDAPLVRCSAKTGEGWDELAALLERAAEKTFAAHGEHGHAHEGHGHGGNHA